MHDEESSTVGHDGKEWPHTMDASIWATEFCKRNSASDHGAMIGWFANAVMVGYDTAVAQAEQPKVCCSDPAHCDKPCSPRADYWKNQVMNPNLPSLVHHLKVEIKRCAFEYEMSTGLKPTRLYIDNNSFNTLNTFADTVNGEDWIYNDMRLTVHGMAVYWVYDDNQHMRCM